jgi:hypothetical protein
MLRPADSGQLPQHLLSQLGLAVAQPGLLLQALGAGLLRGRLAL